MGKGGQKAETSSYGDLMYSMETAVNNTVSYI